MNYRHLVETGEYDPKEVRGEYEQGLLAGLKEAQKTVESATVDYFLDDSLTGKLKAELVEEVADQIKTYLECDYCEAVIAFLDDQAE